MTELLLIAGSALWLGILTSISPCPMATNIAAISYIGKQVKSPGLVFTAGLLYTLGRMLAYLVLGIIIITSLLSVPKLSWFLQKKINIFLGPVLIIAGLFLTGLLKFSLPSSGLGSNLQTKISKMGIWGAGLLGILFALSFCPVSAALFFGSLIPLAVKHNSSTVIPLLYGLGTALPVILFAFILGYGTHYLGRMFDKITKIEIWARRFTGLIFIIVGIYYCLIYIFKLEM
ncbi:MAG: sulfite exporter TauE/SafE family protein [candidate division Zixibacteria bacterium]|nr:sulfite exporter TauE/SafE family protein [candidate division Zixibacteria bacterium]